MVCTRLKLLILARCLTSFGIIMSISVKLEDRQLIFIVLGNFDFHLLQPFREAYKPHLGHQGSFVFDFRHVDYIDSAGIGMLMTFRKQLKAESPRVILRNCNPRIRKILMISRLDKKFIFEQGSEV